MSAAFTPGPDESGEYEVADLLDIRHRRGHPREFLVLWKGYSVYDATWEPEPHLSNAPDIVAAFCSRRGLPSQTTALSGRG